MKFEVYHMDAGTSEAFKGNPTSVCILSEECPDEVLQSIATEFNQPVTIYILPKTKDAYPIRYFTPTTEISACGHGTLAAGKLLYLLNGILGLDFITIKGLKIPVTIESGRSCIQYPIYSMKDYRQQMKPEFLSALGINDFVSAHFVAELEMIHIELKDPFLLRKLNPDYKRLVESEPKIDQVVITSISDQSQFDFLLRSFCPWIGIDEDPVTGSVHSFLGLYWKNKLGKASLNAFQASPRGGEIQVSVTNDKSVSLKADAVLIFKGEMELNL